MLTTKLIQDAKPGVTLKDDVVRGLELRALPNGRKVFYIYFRTKTGRVRRPRIEDFGAITLAQARDAAREILGFAAKGHDPVADRQADRAAPIVADLCDKYLRYISTEKKEGKKPRSIAEDTRLIVRHVKPDLGQKRVKDVAIADVERVHKRMADTPYQANRVLALLSRMFRLSESWLLRPTGSNPCRHVVRYTEIKRQRYMKPDEAPRVAAVLEQMKETRLNAVVFIYLLVLSGARPEEIARARPEWIERVRDAGVLRLPDSKTGARPVYLPPAAMRLVDALPPMRDGTLLGIKSPKALWADVRREANVPTLRMYDLRHTFASTLLEAGYTLAQIGELLGHASEQTTKRYTHLLEGKAHEAATAAATILEQRMALPPGQLAD